MLPLHQITNYLHNLLFPLLSLVTSRQPLSLIHIFIAFSNIQDFSLDRIFPILGFGTKETFITGASNIFAYSGDVYKRQHLKCDQDRTERIVAAAITTVVVETEHACMRTTIATASAVEERNARVRKERAIAVPRTTV